MLVVYDLKAPKKPTNLTINSDLLNKAKKLKINISSVLEHALAERVTQSERDAWLTENAESISSYNEQVKKLGVFGDGIKTF